MSFVVRGDQRYVGDGGWTSYLKAFASKSFEDIIWLFDGKNAIHIFTTEFMFRALETRDAATATAAWHLIKIKIFNECKALNLANEN